MTRRSHLSIDFVTSVSSLPFRPSQPHTLRDMSTLLRPSSRQIARHALSAAQATSRIGIRGVRIPRLAPKSSTSSSTFLLPRRRFYSTEPTPPPKDDKDPKNTDESQGAEKDNAQKKEEAERPKLPEGWVFLEPAEVKTLEILLNTGPARYLGNDNKEIIRMVQKLGAPIQLRELLHKRAKGELSIADLMKAFTIAKDMAKREAAENFQEQTMFNSSEPKLNRQEKRDQSKEGETQGQEGQPKQQDGQKKNKKGKQPDPNVKVLDVSDLLGWVLAAALFFPIWSMIFPNESHEISWSEFRKNYLDRGLVKRLTVLRDSARCLVKVELNQEAVRSVYPDSPVAKNPNANLYVSVGSPDIFEKHMDDAQWELQIPTNERIPITYEAAGQFGNLLLAFGPTLLLVGLIFWAQRRGPGGGGSGGMFGFSKSKAKMYNHESAVKVKFSDVAGMDEAKVEIMEFVSFLKTPERFQKLGAKIPRGAILSGPPGTGKTLLAKATAGESQVPFFSVSGSEFVEMFVGVGASRVRDLFAQARKNAPCIVFIDEIDAIGRSRSDGNRGFGGNEEREATLNQILTEMDGFNTQEQIVVLAGTNRPDVLDKALMRPGRFDRQIYIDRPTMKGRVDIFKVHLQKIVTKEDMEHLCGRLSALTPGFSGADIANAVNEAALVGMSCLEFCVCPQLCLLTLSQLLGQTPRASRWNTSRKPLSESLVVLSASPWFSIQRKRKRSLTTRRAMPSAAGSSNSPILFSKSPLFPVARALWAMRSTCPWETPT